MKVADSDVYFPQQFTLSASYSGTSSNAIYVVVDDPDRLITSAWPAVSDGRASLTLQMSTVAAPGHYTKPVVIKACKDADCTHQYAGSPQTVPKDVLIESIAVGASSLSFSAPVGAGATPQDLAVTPPAGKSYQYSPFIYVEYRAPSGSTSLISSSEVFDITYTATGLQIKPKGASEGSYHWTLQLDSQGYNRKQVDISYEVAGATVQPLTLLNTSLTASLTNGDTVFADVDVLVNMPFTEMRVVLTGSPDPVQTGWLHFYDLVPFTSGSGPADNARHLRFKFDRCGYGIGPCLSGSSQSANARIEVTAFAQTWIYNVPVTLTMP